MLSLTPTSSGHLQGVIIYQKHKLHTIHQHKSIEFLHHKCACKKVIITWRRIYNYMQALLMSWGSLTFPWVSLLPSRPSLYSGVETYNRATQTSGPTWRLAWWRRLDSSVCLPPLESRSDRSHSHTRRARSNSATPPECWWPHPHASQSELSFSP